MANDSEQVAEQRNRVEIADELRRRIRSGGYPVGSKLPSYRQLASELGAAVNTVGEAVRLLATEGHVTLKSTAGAVINEPDGQPATAEDQLRDTRTELVRLRHELRALSRAADDAEGRVASLISRLPNQ